jgi:Contractile injection system tube protein
MTAMGLEKATITDLDNDEEIEVLFNPKEYVLEKEVRWPEHAIQGLDSPAVQFTCGEREVLSMELFFDTSNTNEDVRDHTDKVKKMMLVDADLHRPPLLQFSWGGLRFKGVLEELAQRFTMFLEDGKPVRATQRVVLREYASSSEQFQENPRNSADHTKVKKVEQGDTLANMSAREYNDPQKWRVIADANGIEDPMEIEVGDSLRVPPIV